MSKVVKLQNVVEYGVYHNLLGAETLFEGETKSFLGLNGENVDTSLFQMQRSRSTPQDLVEELAGLLTRATQSLRSLKRPLYLVSGGVDSSLLLALMEQPEGIFEVLHSCYVDHLNNDLEKFWRIMERFRCRAMVFSLSDKEYLEGLQRGWKAGLYGNTYLPTLLYITGGLTDFDAMVTGSGPDELFYGMEKYSFNHFRKMENLELVDAIELIDYNYNEDVYQTALNAYGRQLLSEVKSKRKGIYRQISQISENVYEAQRVLAYYSVTEQHLGMFNEAASLQQMRHVAPYLSEEIIRFAFRNSVFDFIDLDVTKWEQFEIGKLGIKSLLARFMHNEHVYSRKIGFHAPSRKYFRFGKMRTLLDAIDYDALSILFNIDHLKMEIDLRLNHDQAPMDYFLYSLSNVHRILTAHTCS